MVHGIFAQSTNIAKLDIERDGSNSMFPRRSTVHFVHGGGVAVHIEFDAESSLDRDGIFCMPWYTILNTDACLSDAFGLAVGGSINPHHFGKCTVFADSFDELCETLRKAVACLDSGEAYDRDREAGKVVENGTWKERAARFEQWRADWQAERVEIAA
jgi:hypothetical protein